PGTHCKNVRGWRFRHSDVCARYSSARRGGDDAATEAHSLHSRGNTERRSRHHWNNRQNRDRRHSSIPTLSDSRTPHWRFAATGWEALTSAQLLTNGLPDTCVPVRNPTCPLFANLAVPHCLADNHRLC